MDRRRLLRPARRGLRRTAPRPAARSDIDDLLRFIERTDVPLFVQAALAHAQFETIHYFVDGNGRTGRARVHAMLRRGGLTRRVTVPVSAGLLTNTSTYFEALGAYRDGQIQRIVERFAAAAFAAVVNGRLLVRELDDIRARWHQTVRARRDSAAWRLVDVLMRQPVIDTNLVARELDLPRANALRPVAPLVEAGALSEFTGFRRNRMWQAREVLDALDAFAERALRSQPDQL
ncbi:MAG TPA: Fic family protein [Frankiaceae bacterium]|nr:Fic family protein [Frankiaceae bacterium]